MTATLSLIRQDPARAALVRGVLTGLAVGFLFRLVPDISVGLAVLDAGRLPGGFAYLYLVLTGFIVMIVLNGNSWTRSSRLALGLPISARKAWTVRMIWLISIAVLTTAALAVSIGITVDLQQSTVIFNPVVLLTAARAAVASVLILFLFQLPQSAQSSIPITAAYVVYMVMVGVITLVFSSVVLPSIAGTFVLLLLTIPLGVYLYVRLPLTFSAGPTVEESQMPVWTIPDESDVKTREPLLEEPSPNRRHPTLVVHWALFRGLKRNVLIWIHLFLIIASATVVTLEFFDGTNAFVPLFFLMIYFLPVLQGSAEGMTPFDPLPISRRVLWAHGAVPAIAAALLGIGIGLASFALNPIAYSQVKFSGCCAKVPWEYLELSRNGQVPTLTSAWGERFTPRANPLWSGQSIALYNPYDSGPESSPRFAELQMRRAVQAVYGIPVPSALLDADYASPSNISSGVERGAFTLEETRGRVPAGRSRTAALAVLLLTALTTALMIPALLQYGRSPHRKLFKWASIGFVIFLVVLTVAVATARLKGLTEVWYVGALVSIGIRSLSQLLPLPTSILWIFCVTSWAGAYLLLERIFLLIEFPREKTMNRFAEEY